MILHISCRLKVNQDAMDSIWSSGAPLPMKISRDEVQNSLTDCKCHP